MNLPATTIILLVLLLPLAQCARYTQKLNKWTFKIENNSKEYSSNSPSCLAWDLIDNKIVSNDPYFRDNFLQFYQYETKDAYYKTTFNISSNLINSQKQYLIFEGLDTHAQVYLNGQRILSAHNMFRTYEVQVKFKSTNELAINFTSSVKYDLLKEKQFKDQYGFSLPYNYSFTRKAAYQYGWDWGPRILSVGIWKNVTVLIYNDSRIDNVRFIHSAVTKTTKSIDCQVKVDLMHLDKNAAYNFTLLVSRKANNATLYAENISLKETILTELDIPFTLNNNVFDNVWWTWDLGQPNLISIYVKLTNIRNLQTIDYSLTTGIRTVKVIQQTNKTYNGSSFTFNLNGYDLYIRGANYIPPEMSLARTTRQTYQKVRNDALFGRFNMLRLWGGGQFEKDEFYQTMDAAGILIWHDLMFACALYPSSSQILQNIQAEVTDNVKRIRHHPSIALWNGNNEVYIGWLQWGWQNGLTDSQKKIIESMYSDIFKVTLPKVLKQLHPEVYYWQTSPSVSAATNKSINSGDIHFWKVWAEAFAIQAYEDYVGRFNSQYGMQSMPEMSSLQQFTRPDDLVPNSLILRLHERHVSGEALLTGYTTSYVGSTYNITRFSYYSQVMQAYALEFAITNLRLNKPFNMGSLYWQLNDVWPVSSWSSVDYHGTYKASHYRVRQAHEQLYIHTIRQKTTGDYMTYIVNDYNKTFNCQSVLEIYTFAGESTKVKHTIEKTVKPFEKVLVYRFTKSQYGNYLNSGFISTRLRTVDNYVSNNNYFFKPMKGRQHFNPELSYNFEATTIKITTKRLASYVWIYRKKNDQYIAMNLSDNFFTLIPGQSRVIDIGNVPYGEVFVTCYELQYLSETPSHLLKDQ